MSIVRKHRPVADNYTVISNDWVRDQSLSYQAIGLLAQLMSHREGWQVSIRSLAGKHKAGRDAIRTIVAELETAGYLVRVQTRDEETKRFGETMWETREPGEPLADEPFTADPTTANPTTKKNKDKEEQVKELSESKAQERFDLFWSIYPRKDDKKPAKKAFDRLSEADQLAAIEGAKRYAADPNLGTRRWQKMGATWLNGECWNNGPLPEMTKFGPKVDKIAERERENAERLARLLAEEAAKNEQA